MSAQKTEPTNTNPDNGQASPHMHEYFTRNRAIKRKLNAATDTQSVPYQIYEAVLASDSKATSLRTLIDLHGYQEHTDDKGNTPLHVAVEQGNLLKVEILLRAIKKYNGVAQINAFKLNNEGKSALHLAAINSAPKVAKALIDLGVLELSTPDKKGNTAVHDAVLKYYDEYDETSSAPIKIFEDALAENNAPLLIMNGEGKIPLELALMRGDKFTSEILLKNKSEEQISKLSNDVKLLYAVMFQKIELVAELLNNGANPNFSNAEKNTLAELAIGEHYNLDILKLLLEGGAGIGGNLLHTAIEQQISGDVSFDASDGADPVTSIKLVCEHIKKTEQEECLNDLNNFGYTPLFSSIQSSFVETFYTLLDFGANPNPHDFQEPCDAANPNPKNNQKTKTTAFHLILDTNLDIKTKISMINALVIHGANINLITKYGGTAIHKVIEREDHFELLVCLINNSADVNIKDHVGQTPLIKLVEKINKSPDKEPKMKQLASVIIPFLTYKDICDNLEFIHGELKDKYSSYKNNHMKIMVDLVYSTLQYQDAPESKEEVTFRIPVRNEDEVVKLRKLLESYSKIYDEPEAAKTSNKWTRLVTEQTLSGRLSPDIEMVPLP